MRLALQKRQFVALALVLAMAIACASVAPGQDPILVRAQQTYSVALDSLDLLFTLEHDNKDLIESKLPGTHAVVDKIKVQAKVALPALLSAIDVYKVNKDKALLLQILAQVDNLLRSAQEILPKITVATGHAELGAVYADEIAYFFEHRK